MRQKENLFPRGSPGWSCDVQSSPLDGCVDGCVVCKMFPWKAVWLAVQNCHISTRIWLVKTEPGVDRGPLVHVHLHVLCFFKHVLPQEHLCCNGTPFFELLGINISIEFSCLALSLPPLQTTSANDRNCEWFLHNYPSASNTRGLSCLYRMECNPEQEFYPVQLGRSSTIAPSGPVIVWTLTVHQQQSGCFHSCDLYPLIKIVAAEIFWYGISLW